MSRTISLFLAVALLLTACGPPVATWTPPVAPETGPAATVPPSTPAVVAPTATETAVSVPAPAWPADVTDLPDGALYEWQPFVGGLERPVDIQSAGDGSERLFVVEQPGRIRVVRAGQLLPDPFLEISDRLTSRGSEQGLLGLAFHPRFAENGLFFVNYTDRRGDTVIARFQADPAADRADPASEVVLLRVPQPYSNHNGGGLAFGPDGYLYIALGDGGSAGDPQNNAQSLDSLLGKLLRINVDAGLYAIPADNPFAQGGGRAEIWASGLRNPWRIAFDRATGDVYIGDVGQNEWEEIDFLPAGAPGGVNFGWRYREGLHDYKGVPPAGLILTDPVAEYRHEGTCSVTGGVVYRGGSLDAFQGVYLYGDFCRGQIWGLLRVDGAWRSSQLFATGFTISTFGQDERGEVYVANYAGGMLYRLVRK